MSGNSLEWRREHPIFCTKEEMKKPPEEILEGIRKYIAKIRGKLSDIGSSWPRGSSTGRYNMNVNWFALRRAFCWVLGHKYLKYIAFNKDGGPEFITGWTCYVCLRERP